MHYVVDVVETLGQHEEDPASTEQPVDGEPGDGVLPAIHIHQHHVLPSQAGRHDRQSKKTQLISVTADFMFLCIVLTQGL